MLPELRRTLRDRLPPTARAQLRRLRGQLVTALGGELVADGGAAAAAQPTGPATPPQPATAPATAPSASILDQYATTAPSPQNALDIFRGEWSSRLPPPLPASAGGSAGLFDDERIAWFDEVCQVAGKAVLELGPLEGGHTYMLERRGAERVVAVEANSRAFLKCLVVKELLGLERARFLHGDFVEYLREPGPRFDLCVASGVLYHMRDPVELLGLLAERCAQDLMLWTHYHDPAVIVSRPELAVKFPSTERRVVRGFEHTAHRYEYGAALGWSGFCGGSAPYSNWLARDEILGALRFFGFGEILINHDQLDHPNGPAFSVIARRTR